MPSLRHKACAEEPVELYFPGDNLCEPCCPRGLPIGNLTSQFFANAGFPRAMSRFHNRFRGLRNR